MTPAETAIREALEAGPTPGPWKACRSYECFDGPLWDIDPEDLADFECRPFVRIEAAGSNIASAHDLFEFKTADAKLIAACNPAALAELLAELDGERNRSQMYADLVRGVAVVLHGEGWSDTSKLPQEVAALKAKRKPLTDHQRTALFLSLNEANTQAETASAMFTLIVQAAERAHGITGD